ncbi:MAG: 50S ribosomal protein L19 [Candidatus Omnitrophica bacterium]|nr:50S ribosomal protein L19 [Candidatus Omnitrophota bacterium]
MSKIIEHAESKYLKKDIPAFNVGDTVFVHVKIKEEGKTRIQVFDGIVIKKKGAGTRATFTVRRISYGEGVERTFLLNSPFIAKIEIKKKGAVRRAKLNYLRKRKGKKSKVEEKIERDTTQEMPTDTAPRAESA